MNTFIQIIKMCEQYGFISSVKYPKLQREVLKIGSTGAFLMENLRQEWFNNIVINKDVSTFISTGNLSETFDYAKKMCLGQFPFSIAEISKMKTTSVLENNLGEKQVNFREYFEVGDNLSCWVFVEQAGCVQFFHQWQKQRRMWWRKVLFYLVSL